LAHILAFYARFRLHFTWPWS